jgi:hypothetical protein
MLPMVLAVWWASGDLAVWAKVLIQIGGITFGLFLYAYVELTIYQESVFLTKPITKSYRGLATSVLSEVDGSEAAIS